MSIDRVNNPKGNVLTDCLIDQWFDRTFQSEAISFNAFRVTGNAPERR